MVLNETEQNSNNRLGIHVSYLCLTLYIFYLYYSFRITNQCLPYFSFQFSCLATFPTLPSPADSIDAEANTPQTGLVLWTPLNPKPVQELSHLPAPRHKSEPLLILKLFVTESYEQRRIGPCVITADHRVYVEVCVCSCVFYVYLPFCQKLSTWNC